MHRFLLALALLSCKKQASPPDPAPETPPATQPDARAERPEASRGIESDALAAQVEAHWDGLMERYPTWATDLGDHRFDDRVTDISPEARQAWNTRLAELEAELTALEDLSASDALTRDLLVHELRTNRALAICRGAEWSFSPRDNPALDATGLTTNPRIASMADLRNLVTRLEALADRIDVRIANVRAGLADGFVANRASTELVVEQSRRLIDTPLEESPLLSVLDALPESFTDAQRETARSELAEIVPRWTAALQRWVDFLEAEILPAARTADVGLTGIPSGAACYAAQIESHTSLPIDPEELHQTGLDEIARLHREVAMLGKRSLGETDVQAIFTYLRTSPALYFETEQQVEDKAVEALARAKAAIPAWFGRLPQADCEVRRIPDYEAPYTTIAYYMPVVPGEEPGFYYVNTYQPETRPRHEAEVLAFHESIPGHHLQIAIAKELGELPLFRRNLGATAFVEGWALYSEQLSDEMGLYSGDTDRLGMYSFELWRAARLVVDTGIHHKGWTRQQAIDFMLENTPLAENNIVNEVDRYVTTPGQALAYKTGQLEIWRLRRDAEARLGERFDIKSFHDVVLGAGAVSLPVLGQRVEAWVHSRL